METILNKIKEQTQRTMIQWDQTKKLYKDKYGINREIRLVVCEDSSQEYTQEDLEKMYRAQQKEKDKHQEGGEKKEQTIVQLLNEHKIILKNLAKLDSKSWELTSQSITLDEQEHNSSLSQEQLDAKRRPLQDKIKSYQEKGNLFKNQLINAQELINRRFKIIDAIFAEIAQHPKIQDGLYAYYKEHISEFIIFYDRELTSTEQWLDQWRSELNLHVTELESEIKDLYEGREESPNSLISTCLRREDNPTSFDLSAEKDYYDITRKNIKREQTVILTKAAQAAYRGDYLQKMRFLLSALMHDFLKMFPNEEKRKNFEEDVKAISKAFTDREVSILKSILGAAGYERKSTKKQNE